MPYDPNDLEDPLRHRFSERRADSTFSRAVDKKTAAGLGVPVDALDNAPDLPAKRLLTDEVLGLAPRN